MKAEVCVQHAWLRRLAGEWAYESVPLAGSDPAAPPFGGSETVRALGEVWVLCEGRGRMPDGSSAQTQMTLGYDPVQGRFVGTWIGSMMNHLWIYRSGALDAAERTLSLDAEGPAFDGPPGTLAQYRDVIEIVGPGERLLHGHLLAPDGGWSRFMTMRYRRTG